MPRRTLALISGLVAVTVVLFIVAIRSNQQQQQQVPQITQQPVPTSPAHSVLSLSPTTVNVAPGEAGSADVIISTSDNQVTAVQLELSYDPKAISNVKVVSGPLFSNPIVLINKNNVNTGQLTYAFGITPSGNPVNGIGPVATISFVAKNVPPDTKTQLTLLPTTLVTARGVKDTVLKSSSGAVVVIGEQAPFVTNPVQASPAVTGTGY